MPEKLKVEPTKQRVRAAFRPATLNEEDRTVEVVFTTGQAGRRYDWDNGGYYIEELEVSTAAINTERLDKGLSVIDSHKQYEGVESVFGITEEYRIENGELIGTVRFASDKKSDKIFQKVKEKILRHCSLGYAVEEYTKKAQEDNKLPTYIASRWSPNELSFVPVSFETNNGVRSNDHTQFLEIQIREETIMNLEQLRADLAAAQTRAAPQVEIDDLQRQIDAAILAAAKPPVPAAPAAEPVRAAAAAVPAPIVTPAAPVDENAIRVAAATAERGNLQPMLDACRHAGLNDDFAIRNYAEGISLDKHREMVITELSDKSSENLIRTAGTSLNEDERSDQKQQTREAAQNAILYRCGTEIKMTDSIRQYTGLTMHEMARVFVEASGTNTTGMSRQKVAQRAFHSTSDFPLILENVMHKSLAAGYNETPQTWRDLGRRTTVNDFRLKHTYNMGDAPDLLPLGEHGEYQSGTMGEGKEKYKIGTFARKIGYTRQMLINDDMGALVTMPTMFGQSGSRLESDVVWGLLLGYNFRTNTVEVVNMEDGLPLYDAGHNNLLGAGSAFGVDAISDVRKLGRKFKTLDGNFMNITFNDIVIPEDIETTVEQILVQNFTAITSETTNPFQNKLRHRVEPRLGVVSQTAWFAFSNMLKSFEYAYLAGEEEMYTEVNTHTDIDGLEIKVRKDFGAGLAEYRASVKATGAA